MKKFKYKRKPKKIVKFKTPKVKPELNLATVMFLIVFSYLVVGIFVFFTTEHVALYEAREGTLLKNSLYNGVVIREELVVSADGSGYANFFIQEGGKVAKNQNMYTLSDTEIDISGDGEEEDVVEISATEQQEIIELTTNFVSNSTKSQINGVNQLKDSIQNTLQKEGNANQITLLEAAVEDSQGSITVHPSPEDGIVSYVIDGYENVTVDTVTEKNFDKANYHSAVTIPGSSIEQNESLYKLIMSDIWSIAIPLSEEDKEDFKDIEYMEVTFNLDDSTLVGEFEIDGDIGVLTFDKGMIRYSSERYLDIELNISDKEGIKIPNTSIVEFDTYVIPKAYVVLDNDGDYVLSQSDEGVLPIRVDIKKSDESNYYISTNEIPENLVINLVVQTGNSNSLNSGSVKLAETFMVSDSVTLKGVYNVDDGYTKIIYVNVLSSNEEYSIVEEGVEFSLENYDHIVLNSDTTKEHEII